MITRTIQPPALSVSVVLLQQLDTLMSETETFSSETSELFEWTSNPVRWYFSLCCSSSAWRRSAQAAGALCRYFFFFFFMCKMGNLSVAALHLKCRKLGHHFTTTPVFPLSLLLSSFGLEALMSKAANIIGRRLCDLQVQGVRLLEDSDAQIWLEESGEGDGGVVPE